MNDIQDLYPVQVAEYAVLANRIAMEPAFNWRVHHVVLLHKRNQIVSKVKTRYQKTTHKIGIRLPNKTVEETLLIDEESGTDLWQKALNKENV
jgi:hypothetical protein